MSAPVREDAVLEVTVSDSSGQETSARTRIDAHPADVEVGVRRTAEWVERGASLDVEAIVIAPGGEPVAKKAVEVRIVREGWHTYWEWAKGGGDRGGRGEPDDDDPDDGRTRRDARGRARSSTGCRLVSGEEPVRCAFTAERPGTYVLEATTKDAKGRTSTASQRVYVAGPEEHPIGIRRAPSSSSHLRSDAGRSARRPRSPTSRRSTTPRRCSRSNGTGSSSPSACAWRREETSSASRSRRRWCPTRSSR